MMVLKIRNVHGVLVVLALGAVLALATWYASADMLVWLVYGLAWLLLLAGPRPVLELALKRGRAATESDAAQLARLTHLPGPIWIILWLGTTIAALAWGTVLMLPEFLPGTS